MDFYLPAGERNGVILLEGEAARHQKADHALEGWAWSIAEKYAFTPRRQKRGDVAKLVFWAIYDEARSGAIIVRHPFACFTRKQAMRHIRGAKRKAGIA